MTIVRVGTNRKYSDGWDAAFGKKQPVKSKKAKTSAKGATKKAAGKKSAKKKGKK